MEFIISERQLKTITEQFLGQAPKEIVNPFDFGKIWSQANNVSSEGLDLIKKHESFQEKPYIDDAGKLTVGYGTRIAYSPELKNKKISDEVATAYLKKKIDSDVVPAIKQGVKTKLNQNQLNALASLVYNIGKTQFLNSELLKALNSKNAKEIKKNWGEFKVGGGKVLPGLVKRREEEINLFFTK
jgi:GH24 family phage-related lysozyme (muramidase)